MKKSKTTIDFLMLAEMAKSHTPWYQDNKHLYRTPTLEMIEEGLDISKKDIEKLQNIHKNSVVSFINGWMKKG
eukprot:TRINITY_DN11907_c0_g1_i1.p1 TRINITY_DN11907_c0_g1~~TRINITY_DN11907_c0_g1_i1.p1  ORF type:complete len:73 (-),score=13.00 TRINITY_DN11907_c0_g1_i1:28-246(-)